MDNRRTIDTMKACDYVNISFRVRLSFFLLRIYAFMPMGVCLVNYYAEMGGIDMTTPPTYGSIAAVSVTPPYSQKMKKTLSAVEKGQSGSLFIAYRCRNIYGYGAICK